MTKSKGTHWLSLFIDINIAVYFDSFGIEHIPQEVLSKISNKLINHNIFRIQDNDYILCGFYCIAFIQYMLTGKTLLDFISLFSQNDYQNNYEIICICKYKHSSLYKASSLDLKK